MSKRGKTKSYKGGYILQRPTGDGGKHFIYHCWDCKAIHECHCHPATGFKKPHYGRCYRCKVKRGEIDEATFGLPTWE